MKTKLSLFLALFFLLLPQSSSLAHQDMFELFGVAKPKRIRSAPDFMLKNIDGEMVDLKSLKGKPILLNFWATWCEACKEELPSMQRLHEAMEKEGVQVLAISIDRGNQEKIKDTIKKYNLTFPVLLDPDQKIRKNYYILGLPTSYLIDANGILRGFISGARPWDSKTSFQIMRDLKTQFQKVSLR